MTSLNDHIFPSKEGEVSHLVVLLHGAFSSGREILDILGPQIKKELPNAKIVSPDARKVVPEGEGPYPEKEQRLWYDIEGDKLQNWRDEEHILRAYIDDKLKDYGLETSGLIIVGYSQGAIVGLDHAVQRPEKCAGVFCFAAKFLDPDILEKISAKPPVTLIHGDQDTSIDPKFLGETADMLESVGVEVQTHMIEGMGAFYE